MKKSAILIAISIFTASAVFANGNEKKLTPGMVSQPPVSIRTFTNRPGFKLAIAPNYDVSLDIFDESNNIVYHQYLHDHAAIAKSYNLSTLPSGVYRVKTTVNKIVSTEYITVN